MTQFCAFLRGVNVRGTNMKMAEVCQVFSAAGMQQVRAVLASGNILFQSKENVEHLKPKLEAAMAAHFDYEAFLFIKNQEEVQHIYERCPYAAQEDFHRYVFIGEAPISQVLMQKFELATKASREAGQIVDDVFYWLTPKGQTLESSFGKVLGQKNLKDQFTSRNLNTLSKILQKFAT